jgi:hypothetical protein
MSLDAYSLEEHERLVHAGERYGNYYWNAHKATIMLSNIMVWPVTDCDLFIRFLSQMKKYHTLSMISTVRLHRIQAKMNLRYFVESTVNAAYTLVHTDTKAYFDYKKRQQPKSQKASRQAYKWIEGAYIEHSDALQAIKDTINEHTAHANVMNSQHNFRFVPGERAEIHTSFVDFEEDEWIKVDLWACAQAGLIAIDLLLAVQKKYGGFLPSREVDGLAELIVENGALLSELEATRGIQTKD